MSRLALFLLGPPRIELDGKPVRIQRRKALALLVYLAVTGRSHSRDFLAKLLWHINLSAPRIVRPAPGDLAVQTVCAPVSDERPAIGGLLLWKDKENYVHLDRGAVGEHDILFSGCLENQDVVIGRGRLPFDKSANQQISKSSGRVFLRLERVGERANALRSADGETWFTIGHVPFPVEDEDPVQVGLHAIGNIDRTVYHGAYPDGTAIRFESFQLWDLNR